MYYYFLKKRLLIYILVGTLFSILIGINTVLFYQTRVLSSYKNTLMIIAGKRNIMLKEIQLIKNNITKAQSIIPVNVVPEEVILSRIDQIRSFPGINVRLEGFIYEKEMVRLPVIITLSTTEYIRILKLLQFLNFRTFPLFYYESITLKTNLSREMINCNIKGYIFTPVMENELILTQR